MTSPTPAELFDRFRDSPLPLEPVVAPVRCRSCRDLARRVADLTERTYVLAAQEARARTDAYWTTKDLVHAQDRAFKAETRLGERTAMPKVNLLPEDRAAIQSEFASPPPAPPVVLDERPVWGSE